MDKWAKNRQILFDLDSWSADSINLFTWKKNSINSFADQNSNENYIFF